MNDFQRKIEEFFRGRHGSDQLSFTLSLIGLILVFCSPAFTNQDVRLLFSAVGMALIIFAVFRVFSKNEARRRRENDVFMSFFRRDSAKSERRKAEKEKKYLYSSIPTIRQPNFSSTEKVMGNRRRTTKA